jgi:hypothetical protein
VNVVRQWALSSRYVPLVATRISYPTRAFSIGHVGNCMESSRSGRERAGKDFICVRDIDLSPPKKRDK